MGVTTGTFADTSTITIASVTDIGVIYRHHHALDPYPVWIRLVVSGRRPASFKGGARPPGFEPCLLYLLFTSPPPSLRPLSLPVTLVPSSPPSLLPPYPEATAQNAGGPALCVAAPGHRTTELFFVVKKWNNQGRSPADSLTSPLVSGECLAGARWRAWGLRERRARLRQTEEPDDPKSEEKCKGAKMVALRAASGVRAPGIRPRCGRGLRHRVQPLLRGHPSAPVVFPFSNRGSPGLKIEKLKNTRVFQFFNPAGPGLKFFNFQFFN